VPSVLPYRKRQTKAGESTGRGEPCMNGPVGSPAERAAERTKATVLKTVSGSSARRDPPRGEIP
jgi:hypothetical protein